MKTSNKILVGSYLTLLLIAILTMAFVRMNTEEAKPIEPIGEVRTETMNFQHLNMIEASLGNITLLQGEPKVEITCADNIFSHLNKGDDNGKFYLHRKQTVLNPIDVEVKVYANDLKDIILHSNTQLKSKIVFQVDSLNIETFNSSQIDMNIEANALSIKSSNESGGNLEGTANHFKATVTNTATIEAYELVSKTADVKSSNSGVLNTYATEKLWVRISNSALINYRGNPEIVQQSVIDEGQLSQMKIPD